MTCRGRLFVALLGIVACVSVLAVGQSTPLIPWDPQRPLTWADFQGVPPSNASQLSEAAMIAMELKYYATYTVKSERGNGYAWVGWVETAIVSNTMNPRFSWVVRSRATDAILRHEQVHFDLNEVYRRRLESELLKIRVQGPTAEATLSALSAEIERVGDGLLDWADNVIHDRYDAETGSGTRADVQARWEQDVASWLVTPALAPGP